MRDIAKLALQDLRRGQEIVCTFRTFRAIKDRFPNRKGFKIKAEANIQIIRRA